MLTASSPNSKQVKLNGRRIELGPIEIAISDDGAEGQKYTLRVYCQGAAATLRRVSPACASYDQFRNFQERGELFRHLVEKIETV